MSALAAPHPPPKPRRLVIADVCCDTRRMIRDALSDTFSDILESADGRSLFWVLEAHLAAVNDDVPDLLVIAEERMPVYSGLHALEAWSDVDHSFPFIVLSSAPDHGIRERVHAMGALLLRKPFSARKLCRIVGQLL
jgi:FixJ family two-component response regulator